MRQTRGSSAQRFSATIWPGFVDAMTALLMVLMFVLTIFMVVQSVLREQITTQDSTITDQGQVISDQQQRLDGLGQQVAALGQALGTAESDRDALTVDLQTQTDRAAEAEAAARERAARITRLLTRLDEGQQELANAQSRLTDFEAEVATMLAAQVLGENRVRQLQSQLSEAEQRASAAELAVTAARQETDAVAETARLAAARREALEALVADLRSRNAETATNLTEAEQDRLAEAEAAKLLRDRLQAADTELTAMTLALEEQRQQAEDTLTLLAAANAARDQAELEAASQMSEAERQAALLAAARQELGEQENLADDGQRRVALLNEQVAQLTAQLGSLQALLQTAGQDQADAELQVADLGQQLNAALVRAAEETRRRLALEEEARQSAEAEAQDLARYRSEFFGRLSQILSGRDGIQVVGDRFVFQSEVLFATGEATLSPAGRDQIAGVAQLLTEISDEIPDEIDWIIRVDGHTDNLPLSGTGRYRDNWELSQGRALAVVRYLTDSLGFPANRLAPTGFADTRPIAPQDTPEDRALNRRIELKLTER
ncbi:peptidoglycan -binding protein [Paracoccus sp. JM45]|uniref:peptidoglycan -binding protein n=1 Tax=Paracoccus sp. JM45 TaxID=2283626 RepID=UPI000E6CAAEC|nr:peptidoglycan -binding protein [Paracoccus sp. JM45]RJE79989.1 peptidoglycan -binding protein [Paracoccus sp. JM45]